MNNRLPLSRWSGGNNRPLEACSLTGDGVILSLVSGGTIPIGGLPVSPPGMLTSVMHRILCSNVSTCKLRAEAEAAVPRRRAPDIRDGDVAGCHLRMARQPALHHDAVATCQHGRMVSGQQMQRRCMQHQPRRFAVGRFAGCARGHRH